MSKWLSIAAKKEWKTFEYRYTYICIPLLPHASSNIRSCFSLCSFSPLCPLSNLNAFYKYHTYIHTFIHIHTYIHTHTYTHTCIHTFRVWIVLAANKSKSSSLYISRNDTFIEYSFLASILESRSGVYENMSIWVYEYICVWVYEYMSIWVYEHMSIWVYMRMGIWVYEYISISVK